MARAHLRQGLPLSVVARAPVDAEQAAVTDVLVRARNDAEGILHHQPRLEREPEVVDAGGELAVDLQQGRMTAAGAYATAGALATLIIGHGEDGDVSRPIQPHGELNRLAWEESPCRPSRGYLAGDGLRLGGNSGGLAERQRREHTHRDQNVAHFEERHVILAPYPGEVVAPRRDGIDCSRSAPRKPQRAAAQPADGRDQGSAGGHADCPAGGHCRRYRSGIKVYGARERYIVARACISVII